MTSTMLERDSETRHEPRFTTRRGRWLVLVGLAAVAAVVTGLVLVQMPSRQLFAPAEDSVEVGFARDMSVHHAQAVEMAELVRERTADSDVKQLAVDIALTQQAQIGQMRGWLDVWSRSPSGAGPRMAWMHEPVEGPMPGMATPAELNRLRGLQGDTADEMFLTLMLKHHQAGVAMAEAALDRTNDPVVERFAGAVASAQANEQEVMRQMLGEAQSQTPITGSAGASHGDTMEDH